MRYRVDGNSLVEGQPTKAKKFELLYIRNRFQANERALRECRRLIYSRMTMSVTALADGEWVNNGDMVQVPDTYDTNQQAGYIVSRTGNDFETNERITFSGSMFVQITDSMGRLRRAIQHHHAQTRHSDSLLKFPLSLSTFMTASTFSHLRDTQLLPQRRLIPGDGLSLLSNQMERGVPH